MAQHVKLATKILSGESDANIAFDDLRGLLKRVGFDERIKGSHHILSKSGVPEIITLQKHSKQANPYQVRQVRYILLKYRLL